MDFIFRIQNHYFESGIRKVDWIEADIKKGWE